MRALAAHQAGTLGGMKIVLFDWTTGGHHSRYVQRVAEALVNHAEVIAAVPARTAAELTGVRVHQLPDERPQVDRARRLGPQHQALAAAELRHFQAVTHELKPDHIVHMYGDPIIRWLIREQPTSVSVSLIMFFVRAHYNRLYRTRLGLKERARAAFQVHLIHTWRRRPDAHALLCLDEGAQEFLSAQPGAPVQWFPEPPVQGAWQPTAERAGCVLYGALSSRKGIDLLTRAAAAPGAPLRFVLAGAVEDGFEAALEDAVAAIRRAGCEVDLRARQHDESEGLGVMAQAKCVVLPYPTHFGMSRVLLEAATVGTPVVAHSQGLLGHLVRQWGLGLAVDCRDPVALRHALTSLVSRPDAVHEHAERLRRFTARYTDEAFHRQMRGVFRPGSSETVDGRDSRLKEQSA